MLAPKGACTSFITHPGPVPFADVRRLPRRAPDGRPRAESYWVAVHSHKAIRVRGLELGASLRVLGPEYTWGPGRTVPNHKAIPQQPPHIHPYAPSSMSLFDMKRGFDVEGDRTGQGSVTRTLYALASTRPRPTTLPQRCSPPRAPVPPGDFPFRTGARVPSMSGTHCMEGMRQTEQKRTSPARKQAAPPDGRRTSTPVPRLHSSPSSRAES